MSSNSVIILLTDAREMKRRQQEELAFYRKELARLTVKCELIQREIQVTSLAIRIIENETTANTVSIKIHD